MIIVHYCPCGCVGMSDNPEHIKMDAERRAKGYLDALILPTAECPTCNNEWEQEELRYLDSRSVN